VQPRAGRTAVAILFGVGAALTLDEFALWLHLKDVYWANEGRQSIDAIFCVLAVSGLAIGGVEFLVGQPGTAGWWISVGYLALILVLSLVCMLKGKLVTGVIGIVIQLTSIVGAIRLAKPGSWWARRFYASRPERLARAERRFDSEYVRRWNRVKDFIAGAPTAVPAAAGHGNDRSYEQPELPWTDKPIAA
jgi:hypothetical protein